MTQHLDEEQLILQYYNEGSEGDAAHLESCSECRAGYQRLQVVLNSVDLPVPERPADFEDRMWNKLAPQVKRRRTWLSWPMKQWVAVAAALAIAVFAFVAGRYSGGRPQVAQGPVRERVLIVAVGDHLDRSQMILAELVNAEGGAEVDISDERALAETLLDANRLYRQTATATGETGVANVLEDLERVLLEVTHSSGTLSAAELEDLRQRIESQGLLFKVRVVGSQLRERGIKTSSSKQI